MIIEYIAALIFSKIFLPLDYCSPPSPVQVSSSLWKNDIVYPRVIHSQKNSWEEFLCILSGFFISYQKSMGPLVSVTTQPQWKKDIGTHNSLFQQSRGTNKKKQTEGAFTYSSNIYYCFCFLICAINPLMLYMFFFFFFE